MRSIFLDYASTTPVAASVREAMLPFLGEFYGHPSSLHWLGRASAEALEDARSHVASLLACHPSEIVFTSGGTESVNLGILGVARAMMRNVPDLIPHAITSNAEHACVNACMQQLEREGWQVSYVSTEASGMLTPEAVAAELRPNTRLLSVIHASDRTGVIQPIEEIAELCHQHDILLHTDAAQTVGKVDCNVERLGVDLLSLTGHKFYAPKGVGALYVRLGVPIEPILCGEANEAGLRPGTENVAFIVGLGQAAKLASAGLEQSHDRLSEMRDRFHAQLERLLGRPIPVCGPELPRLPSTLALRLPDVSASDLQRMVPEICLGPTLPKAGGASCADSLPKPTAPSIATETNPLSSYGAKPDQRGDNILRVSIGWPTSEEELQQALHLLAMAYEKLLDRK